MSKGLRWALAITGVVVLVAGLLLAVVLIGRVYWARAGFGPARLVPGFPGFRLPGFGMHMWGGYQGELAEPDYAPYRGLDRGFRVGPGMHGGMMGGSGMMGGYGGGLSAVEPLSLQQAQQAVEEYLARLENEDLQLGEVMVFDNHAYAEIVEKSTGIGAMEVLVDPVTLLVYPEHGPNMMWNLKYSPMGGLGAGYGMMGGMMAPGRPGMMGGYYRGQGVADPPQVSADMPVTPEQAIAAAQEYLDVEIPGATVGEEAEPFYGYYTLHVERDGQITGMLSVNGYSAAVFPHTWHGDFIEMSAEE